MSLSDHIEKLDKDLFLFFNRHGNEALDPFMVFLSQRAVWIPLYILLLILIIRVFKKRTYLFFITASICVFLSDKFSVYMKNAVARYRPCHNTDLTELIRLPDGCGGQFGFVSSHAANTLGIAVFITYFLGRHYKWIPYVMFAWALLVSYSRIYLGAHYPLDILGGFMVGALSAFIAIVAHKRLDERFFSNELPKP